MSTSSAFTPTVQQSPVVLATAAGVEGTVNPYNPASASVVVGGTYTPAISSTTNVASSTMFSCHYMRVGGIVTVSGAVQIAATASGGVVFNLSLPVASNLSTNNDVYGLGANTNDSIVMRVESDTANDKSTFSYVAINSINRYFTFSFTYRII